MKQKTEAQSIKILTKKMDLTLDAGKKLIKHLIEGPTMSPNYDVGNKSWGHIDFLTKYCGWNLITVSK